MTSDQLLGALIASMLFMIAGCSIAIILESVLLVFVWWAVSIAFFALLISRIGRRTRIENATKQRISHIVAQHPQR